MALIASMALKVVLAQAFVALLIVGGAVLMRVLR